MFSTLPQSVCDEGWQTWETERMQREDRDAPPVMAVTFDAETSDTEMSCLSAADSAPMMRKKLNKLVYYINHMQVKHFKRKVQKAAHNARCRNKQNGSHLHNVVDDITSVLSWQTQQTRELDGKFGPLEIH